jgi:precorrin-3B synthase
MTARMPKDWCPGALRPMQSGDGLIVRLRISGGIVDTRLAAEIARWARRWGNGQIDLSGRANLQLRGLSPRHLPELHDALTEWGLLDHDADGEAVRNVVSSPLAGLDPAVVLDIRPIAAALGQRLANDATLHGLPAKFGFVIDDGGWPGLDEVRADIRFVACRTTDGPAFEIRLAGAPDDRLGVCRPDALVDVAVALGCLFLHLRAGRETGVRRMRDLVGERSAATIGRDVGLAHTNAPPAGIRSADGSTFLGAHALGRTAFLGVGLPFGRIEAEDLAKLASAAVANGGRDLRLTPWRAIFAPVPSIREARALVAQLPTRSFILDPLDRRRRVAACPGAPDCSQATTRVRSDAARLAAQMVSDSGQGIVLHVSGCSKGCAHPSQVPVTLVGQDGCYGLVRNGVASDAPMLRNLSLDQAAEHIRQIIADRTRGIAV